MVDGKMKTKTLIIAFVVVGILFLYCNLCNGFLNKLVKTNTNNDINNYFVYYYPKVEAYKYLNIVGDKNDTFKVYIEADDNYYTFYFTNNYKIIKVVNKVPNYIKSY